MENINRCTWDHFVPDDETNNEAMLGVQSLGCLFRSTVGSLKLFCKLSLTGHKVRKGLDLQKPEVFFVFSDHLVAMKVYTGSQNIFSMMGVHSKG